uniref:cyclic AMP-dependent transcription factor ATF-4-like n=1 Tax=Myxine glutinosa TaxID=7769 RepID=UPI00358EF74C
MMEDILAMMSEEFCGVRPGSLSLLDDCGGYWGRSEVHDGDSLTDEDGEILDFSRMLWPENDTSFLQSTAPFADFTLPFGEYFLESFSDEIPPDPVSPEQVAPCSPLPIAKLPEIDEMGSVLLHPMSSSLTDDLETECSSPSTGGVPMSLSLPADALDVTDVRDVSDPLPKVDPPVVVAEVERGLPAQMKSPTRKGGKSWRKLTGMHAIVKCEESDFQCDLKVARSPGDRRLKKMEQNKTAALRYRQRKRQECEAVSVEQEELESRNRELHSKADALSRELHYLRDLMMEVEKAKRCQKANP